MAAPSTYELFAIKYATHARGAHENFVFRDVHDVPMPLDFYVWLARSPEKTFVIDTGFSAETGRRRDRQILRNPREGLAALGVDAGSVEHVIISHLHYDHVGNFDLFPHATLHLQELEMRYATGRYMTHECFRGAYEVEDVVGMVRRVYENRVRFHDGDAEIAPGVSVHLIGGHTLGLQAVRVATRLLETRRSTTPAGYSGFVSPTAHHGVIPAGYANALRPGPCLLNAQRRHILEVGMQSSFIQTTATDKPGDEVVLLGDGLTEPELAAAWHTSPQEVLVRKAAYSSCDPSVAARWPVLPRSSMQPRA